MKVMVFGVFDLLHPGHIHFLRQAKRLGGFLVVSVARDSNVKKIKGFKPAQAEAIRLKNLKKLQFVDQAVLGSKANPWPHIKKEKPDIIALGYDQGLYVMNHESRIMNQERQLERELMKHGVKAKVVRLKAFKPSKFKSSKLRNPNLSS